MKNGIFTLGNCFQYILAVAQTNELFQLISLILSIVTSIVLIVGKIIVWYKDSMKDGKIDTDEVKEVVGIVVDGTTEIKDKIDGQAKH